MTPFYETAEFYDTAEYRELYAAAHARFAAWKEYTDTLPPFVNPEETIGGLVSPPATSTCYSDSDSDNGSASPLIQPSTAISPELARPQVVVTSRPDPFCSSSSSSSNCPIKSRSQRETTKRKPAMEFNGISKRRIVTRSVTLGQRALQLYELDSAGNQAVAMRTKPQARATKAMPLQDSPRISPLARYATRNTTRNIRQNTRQNTTRNTTRSVTRHTIRRTEKGTQDES